MFTDKKSVLELLALLRAHGIRRFVLCPGSRDIPLVEGLARMPENRCTAVTDERSAGFVALGIINATGEPCAVVCTSGSALLNLHPAVSEAYYQQKPLLILSADRPKAWIGQLDGQTLPQAGAFRDLVAYDAELPEVHHAESHWFCNRLINEALLTLLEVQRPVHLNIPITEPFFQFPVKELPEVRVIREATPDELPEILAKKANLWIIVGQESAHLAALAELNPRIPVFAEHLANLPEGSYVPNMDLALSALTEAEKEAIAPDAVLYFGGHIVSKQLKRLIRQKKPLVIHHSDRARAPDLFGCLAYELKGSLEEVVYALRDFTSRGAEPFIANCRALTERLLSQPLISFNQLQLTGKLLAECPLNTRVHLANSSTVRYAEWFHPAQPLRYFCNRGVNGIEGSVSEAVGCALADPEHLHLLIVGDLAYFYDMNVLALAANVHNLRIVLFNNAGGEIFGSLPGLHLQGAGSPYILGVHRTSTRGWCSDCAIRYFSIENETTFKDAMAQLFDSTKGCTLLEVKTDMQNDLEALKSLRALLTQPE